MRGWLICFLVLMSVSCAAPASAQAQPSRAPLREPPRSANGDWYGAQLIDLAHALGGAHSLRLMCARQDYIWLNFMRGVLAREAWADARRLEDAFNRGFRRERARFARCTPQTEAMESELRAEAMRIADALSAANETLSPAPLD